MTDLTDEGLRVKAMAAVSQLRHASEVASTPGYADRLRRIADDLDAALAEHEAKLREARAEGMEMAADLARRLASDSEREADKPSTTANQKIGLGLVRDAARTLETAIRAAAAIRKGEKP